MHGAAVEYLIKYLRGTRSKGIIFISAPEESFTVYADADFAGNWNRGEAEHDDATAKSHTGYVIKFAGCPIVWTSKLQTQIALSTTEAEYIALSEAMRATIPLMNLIEELQRQNFLQEVKAPHVFCKAFEDNAGAIELARLPRL